MLLLKQTPNEREYCPGAAIAATTGAAAITAAPPAVAASAAPALVATKAEVAVPATPAAAQPISSHAYPFSGDFILNEEPQHFLIFP